MRQALIYVSASSNQQEHDRNGKEQSQPSKFPRNVDVAKPADESEKEQTARK
jgi:hypothetical protein